MGVVDLKDARRALMAAALGALLALIAGCARPAAGPSGGVTNANAAALRIGTSTYDSLVPELSGNQGAADAAMLWGAWLYLVDSHGELVPELATTVPSKENGGISADGLTITYRLRKNVAWHDGTPFTADDAIFTWRQIMNPANNVQSRDGYDRVTSMTAPDAHTLVVKLKQPYAPVVATLFAPSLSPYVILPAHTLQGLHDINHAPYNVKPIGTGPFIVERYDTATGLYLRANPRYWRGAPKLARVVFSIVPDIQTRLVQLRTGELDVDYDLPTVHVREAETIPHMRVVHTTFDEFWYLEFNTTRPPLDDVRVRRALSMAIDRRYVVDKLIEGLGEPAIGDQPPYSWARDPHDYGQPYDLKAAAALLDQLGWRTGPDGFRRKNGNRLALQYVTSATYKDGVKFAPILQQQFRALGVDLSIKTYPTSVLFNAKAEGGIANNGKFDILWTGWIGGVDPDDATLWTCAAIPPNGYNHTFKCDPRIDEQERIALGHYDRPTRKRAYSRIQQLLGENATQVFLFWEKRHDVVRDDLKNFDPAPTVTSFTHPWLWQR